MIKYYDPMYCNLCMKSTAIQYFKYNARFKDGDIIVYNDDPMQITVLSRIPYFRSFFENWYSKDRRPVDVPVVALYNNDIINSYITDIDSLSHQVEVQSIRYELCKYANVKWIPTVEDIMYVYSSLTGFSHDQIEFRYYKWRQEILPWFRKRDGKLERVNQCVHFKWLIFLYQTIYFKTIKILNNNDAEWREINNEEKSIIKDFRQRYVDHNK